MVGGLRVLRFGIRFGFSRFGLKIYKNPWCLYVYMRMRHKKGCMYTCLYIDMYLHMHVFIYLFIYIEIYVYVYIYVYMRINIGRLDISHLSKPEHCHSFVSSAAPGRPPCHLAPAGAPS